MAGVEGSGCVGDRVADEGRGDPAVSVSMACFCRLFGEGVFGEIDVVGAVSGDLGERADGDSAGEDESDETGDEEAEEEGEGVGVEEGEVLVMSFGLFVLLTGVVAGGPIICCSCC